MPPLRYALQSVRNVARHPLTRDGGKLSGWLRWVRWQLCSRLAPGPVVIPFTEEAKLLASPAMHGATVNYYTGLGEFDDMGFLLHFLRANDFFLDVGANVGAYSVLAGAVVGCRGIAFEPDAKAFDRLRINLALNHADRRIEGRRQVVGRTAGRVKFTSGLDSLNHVLAEGESVGGRVEEIEAINLDGISWERKPCLVKIDTEGFEPEVLAGGKSFFSDPAIRAIIIEIEHSPRYGVSLDTLFHDVCRRGFVPVRYRPLKRQIEAQAAPLRFDPAAPTSLFVRDPEEAQKRCETARAVRILGKDV